MSDLKKEKVPTIFAGTFVPAPENERWCDGCCKSSKLTGPLVKMGEWGVAHWGKVIGCAECVNWVFTNSKGEIVDVEVIS